MFLCFCVLLLQRERSRAALDCSSQLITAMEVLNPQDQGRMPTTRNPHWTIFVCNRTLITGM